MHEYIVLFHHPVHGSWAYAVNAEDEDHAKEQVLELEPRAKNLTARWQEKTE